MVCRQVHVFPSHDWDGSFESADTLVRDCGEQEGHSHLQVLAEHVPSLLLTSVSRYFGFASGEILNVTSYLGFVTAKRLLTTGRLKTFVLASREDPYSLTMSASLQEIMHYGSSKRSVFFKIKKDDELLIFRFGTTHGEDICGSLQQHINHAFMRRFKAGFPARRRLTHTLRALLI